MKKKSSIPKKVPKRILDLTDQLEFMFSLQNYDRVIFLKKQEGKEGYTASIEVQEEYQRVTINIFPSFFEAPLNEQRQYLLHEFCHTISHPLLEVADNLRSGRLETPENVRIASEKTVSKTTEILHRLLRLKMGYARKAYAKYLDTKKK